MSARHLYLKTPDGVHYDLGDVDAETLSSSFDVVQAGDVEVNVQIESGEGRRAYFAPGQWSGLLTLDPEALVVADDGPVRIVSRPLPEPPPEPELELAVGARVRAKPGARSLLGVELGGQEGTVRTLTDSDDTTHPAVVDFEGPAGAGRNVRPGDLVVIVAAPAPREPQVGDFVRLTKRIGEWPVGKTGVLAGPSSPHSAYPFQLRGVPVRADEVERA